MVRGECHHLWTAMGAAHPEARVGFVARQVHPCARSFMDQTWSMPVCKDDIHAGFCPNWFFKAMAGHDLAAHLSAG